jgi:hypothetical protein
MASCTFRKRLRAKGSFVLRISLAVAILDSVFRRTSEVSATPVARYPNSKMPHSPGEFSALSTLYAHVVKPFFSGTKTVNVAFVVSLNLHRRHLDESQRAMVAAKIATLPKGTPQHAQIYASSQEEAAGLLSIVVEAGKALERSLMKAV